MEGGGAHCPLEITILFNLTNPANAAAAADTSDDDNGNRIDWAKVRVA